MKCEISEIVRHAAYCDRQARWQLGEHGGYLVCGTHKRELDKAAGDLAKSRVWKKWVAR